MIPSTRPTHLGELLVVPVEALTDAFALGGRADTLRGLIARLRRRLAPELFLATPLAVRLALVEVAPDVVRDDEWLLPLSQRGGRAWLRTLDTLGDALVHVSALGYDIGVPARGSDAVARRARVVARLGRALDQKLASVGLLDPRHELDRVRDVVAHTDAELVADAISASTVRARGIVEWMPPELGFFRVLDGSLSRIGGRASIELPVFERPLDAERERDPLDTVIEAVASATDDAPMATPVRASLGDLNIFGEPPSPRIPVEIRSANDPQLHAVAIADAVAGAIAEGAAPEEIIIGFVNDDDTDVLATCRALLDRGIASVDARPSRPLRSNLVAFADSVLAIVERGVKRTDVAGMLRSHYVDARALTDEEDEGSGRRLLRALAHCLDETPTAAGSSHAERLRATVLAATSSAPEVRRELADLAAEVGSTLDRLATATTRTDLVQAARETYRVLGLSRVAGAHHPSGGPVDRRSAVDLEAEGRDILAWARLTEMLDGYEHAITRLGAAHQPSDIAALRHELAWGMAHAPRTPPLTAPVVRIQSFVDLTFRRAELVVVAGADAPSWSGPDRPAIVPAVLLERMLAASDPPLWPILHAGAAKMLARLALVVGEARRVVFTFRTRDDEGQPVSAAPVVAWLGGVVPVTAWTRAAANRLQRTPDAAAMAPELARRADLERRRENAFGEAMTEGDPLLATLPQGESFVGILREETGGGDRPLSASAIDRLASCVFRGFVTEVLRPRRRSPAPDVADAREEGKLVHAAAFAAFFATSALWSSRPRDRERILRLGLEAADHALAHRPVSSELGRFVLIRARASVEAVLEWSVADLDWDFVLGEQAFGEESAWHAVVLERPGTKVAIRGRIDRIDVAHQASAVRVIDYKSGARSADEFTAQLGATRFQLALYARAARRPLDRAGSTGMYLGTHRLRPGAAPKKYLEQWQAAHRTEDGVERFEETVLDTVERLRSGRVEVLPRDADSCSYCDSEGVCRKPRFSRALPDNDAKDADPGRWR